MFSWFFMRYYKREMICNHTIERYGVLTWKTCVLFENYKWCIFFTVGRNLAVIFSVHRMIVVILKLPLLCGEIRALLNQNVTSTRSWPKMRVVKDIFKPSFGRPFFVCSEKENPCSFWQWGDVIRPQCYHGVQCSTSKVKKKVSTTVVCFMLVRRVKMMRVAILSGEIYYRRRRPF